MSYIVLVDFTVASIATNHMVQIVIIGLSMTIVDLYIKPFEVKIILFLWFFPPASFQLTGTEGDIIITEL
jgi:hypothetical protein